MATIAKEPWMCAHPAAEVMKPDSRFEPVVTEVFEAEDGPLEADTMCALPPAQHFEIPMNTKITYKGCDDSELHTKAYDMLDHYKSQVTVLQHVLDDHARELELRLTAEQERDTWKLKAENAEKKTKELEAALAAITATAAALEVKLHQANKKQKETEHRLHETQEDLEKAEHDRDAARKERDTFKHERDTARHERGTFKHERDEARKEVEGLKKDLDTTQKARDGFKQERDAAQKERDAFKEARDAAQKERDSAQKERDTFKKERDTAQKERDTVTQERDAIKTERDAAQKSLEKANKNITWYKERETELEGLLKKANKGQDDANNRASAIEKEKDQAINEKREALRRLHELEESETAPVKSWLPNDKHQKGAYYIDCIEFGGKIVTDQAVYDRLLNHAVKHESFTINNTLLGGDPWPHWTKTCTISYTVGNKGPFRYLTGWEREKVSFDSK